MNWYKKSQTETKIYFTCADCNRWGFSPDNNSENAVWKKLEEMSPEELDLIRQIKEIAPKGISPDNSVAISHAVCDDCWETIYGGDDLELV